MSPAAIATAGAAAAPASESDVPIHAPSSELAMKYEHEYAAHNYHPLPIVFSKALGVHVWDPEGKQYLDFLSAYSAVNQGHCHPKIFVTEYFGYDMVLPMNTGVEAVETSLKLARKWGYLKKGIPENEALIFCASDNFHGRTFAALSLSSDPESRDHYGPYLPNIGSTCPKTGKVIRYNNIADIEEVFELQGKKTAAFLIEPIQGEAGIVVPDDDYLAKVHALCKKHNVLLICDEIQTGIARTGRLLCSEHSGIRPDIVLLGKAISGGVYPVSAVLSDKDIMLCIQPGTHGSTYGGNPLGCAVAIAALEVIRDEDLTTRSEVLGQKFRAGLSAINSPAIKVVRGKGLLNAVVIDESKTNGRTAWDLCLLLRNNGLLAKPTHQNIIRLAPPLVITEEQVYEAIGIIEKSLTGLPTYVNNDPQH
jgi:ornithine--oxo-acid transaminase